MESKTIFHTVEDRENIDYVEQNAPFKCKSKSAWLGEGYYFWDSSIDTAHWWGKQRYKSYLICKTECSYKMDEMYDLYNNAKQRSEFREMTSLIKEKYSSKTVTVPFVIEYLKQNTKFPYKAIRAYAVNSNRNSSRLNFIEKNNAYLDLDPAIQICVIDKSILDLPLKIIYPQGEEFTL